MGMTAGRANGVLTRRLRSLTAGVEPGALLSALVGCATHRDGSPSPARTAGRIA